MRLESVNILSVENMKFERGVKEAIHIRVAKASLSRDGSQSLPPAVRTNLLRARVRGPPVTGLLLMLCDLTTPSWGQPQSELNHSNG